MKLAILTCSKIPQGVADDQGLFEALKNTGIEVHIHAWDAPIQWSDYDACLFRSVWDYQEQPTKFLHWLEQTEPVTQFINSAAIIKWNTDKKYLKELADFGVSIAPTVWLDANKTHDLKTLINQFDATQYFLKPVIGADSSGTYRFSNNGDELIAAQKHLDEISKSHEMMLQPYLNSVETQGETSGMFFASNYSHGVRKIPVNGDYRVQDTFGATDVPYDLNAAEMALSKACLYFLAEKFGTIVYARFDFLQDADGSVYLNEAELFEPSLFFNHDPLAAARLAQSIYINMNHYSET